jgi:DNA polymerase-3 subunit gamma/tau
VQLFYQIALQGREDLPLAPDEHAGFVMTLLRMLAFSPQGVAPELPRAAGGEKKEPPRKAPLGASKPASSPASSPVASASGEWPQLSQALPVTGATRELARNAELRSREGNIFDLVLPKAKAYLADRGYQEKLKAALEKHLGHPVTVKVAVGEIVGATAAAIEAETRDARQADAVRAVQSDGFVKDLVNLFDGKVVDSTIRDDQK